MKNIKIIAWLAFCLTSLNTFAQQTYLLKQNYPIGKKYSYTFNSDQIISQKVDGKELNYIQNVGTDYTFDISEAKAGDKNIKVIYRRLNIKSVGAGNEMILDSDKEEIGKPNPFAGLRNATFNMIMAPNGGVKSISGIDKMVDSMAAKMTTDTAQLKQIKTSLSKQFNAEVIKQSMESSLKIFPDKAVKIGDSWVVNTKVVITMPIESAVTYTLKEVKDGIATLTIKGTLVSKGAFESLGSKMETDLKGMNIGDAQIDLKTGMVLNTHTRLELYGKMKVAEQSVDFNLEGINKVTGKEIN
ncbi:DUF6263 family protein [Pedobacter jejuensis]|uniref:Uncharacterized protein n=1 Tax=Pedobacter jejuensis TaxID=1268550 RepID=A0A3N0BLQ2_9SPHI|nr:DUF6263 family protein [Pedobacter jejuensis]RNL49677.1 hypothetical protein D7004_19905 [Pedobacter jejuensis]